MHKFKFRILFFSLVFFPITILLGIWQINRADEKNDIMEQYSKFIKKIEKLFKKKLKVGVFPINENEWQDLSNWPSSD